MPLHPVTALFKAVETDLRTFLADPTTNPKYVSVGPDGRPWPNAGEWFYSIHDGGEQGESDMAHRLGYYQTMLVTITKKLQAVPNDRAGRELLLAEGTGILDRANALKDRLHGSWAVIGEANTLTGIVAGVGYGWTEPLLFANRSPVEPRTPEWFWSVDEQHGPVGVSTTLAFHRAYFLKPVGSGG